MRVSSLNFNHLSYGFLVLIILGLVYNIINGREMNKSLVKSLPSLDVRLSVQCIAVFPHIISLQGLTLRQAERQIEKEDSERVDCVNHLYRVSEELAKKEKLIVEKTNKANSLELIKNKAIIEAKQLRKQLENVEKEKNAKEKKKIPVN